MPSMAAAQEVIPKAGPSSAAWTRSLSTPREFTSLWCSGERMLGRGR